MSDQQDQAQSDQPSQSLREQVAEIITSARALAEQFDARLKEIDAHGAKNPSKKLELQYALSTVIDTAHRWEKCELDGIPSSVADADGVQVNTPNALAYDKSLLDELRAFDFTTSTPAAPEALPNLLEEFLQVPMIPEELQQEHDALVKDLETQGLNVVNFIDANGGRASNSPHGALWIKLVATVDSMTSLEDNLAVLKHPVVNPSPEFDAIAQRIKDIKESFDNIKKEYEMAQTPTPAPDADLPLGNDAGTPANGRPADLGDEPAAAAVNPAPAATPQIDDADQALAELKPYVSERIAKQIHAASPAQRERGVKKLAKGLKDHWIRNFVNPTVGAIIVSNLITHVASGGRFGTDVFKKPAPEEQLKPPAETKVITKIEYVEVSLDPNKRVMWYTDGATGKEFLSAPLLAFKDATPESMKTDLANQGLRACAGTSFRGQEQSVAFDASWGNGRKLLVSEDLLCNEKALEIISGPGLEAMQNHMKEHTDLADIYYRISRVKGESDFELVIAVDTDARSTEPVAKRQLVVIFRALLPEKAPELTPDAPVTPATPAQPPAAPVTPTQPQP